MTNTARDKSFERVASAYDEVRPGYPAALYDRIIEFGALTPLIEALEVGTGTGKGTLPLAERNFRICGIEPGVQLSERARVNLDRFPRVVIHTTSFEDWTIERSAFGLAFSAQAFHWLDPAQRLQRFAAALKPDGVLALFGNAPALPEGRLRDDLQAAYREISPSLAGQRRAESWYATASSPVMAELQTCDLFYDVQFAAFEWERKLGASDYSRLLSTYSDHSTLPPEQLATLLTRVQSVIQNHGGTVLLSYQTGLFLARRR